MTDHKQPGGGDGKDPCDTLERRLLGSRNLLIVSNRGPVTFQFFEDGTMSFERGGGGLVTALLGLARQVRGTWVATAMSEADRVFREGEISLDGEGEASTIRLEYLGLDPEAYAGYYNVIANPLLWFLQHMMWDFVHDPTITRDTWKAWDDGYVAVNREFAATVAKILRAEQGKTLIMMQDYHLYLVPRFVRQFLRPRDARRPILSHFIHIPWPGPTDWSVLPGRMRESILDGLCANDLLGFQTRLDAMNFIRTCESLLPNARVNYRKGRVWHRNHVTYVRDFPISIDVTGLREQAASKEVEEYYHQFNQFSSRFAEMRMIVRIERIEPSKNIVRGFQAYEEMLETYPEHRGKVQFLALLVPSRLEVEEYQSYLDELMAAAGHVNARYGTSDWEPVRVMVGENLPRALAALRLYDVLLVNPVADGMNLVAKEGPTINERDGALVLSERAGASQQLGPDAIVITPFDVHATAIALHDALTMPEPERHYRAQRLRASIEQNDITSWLCAQLSEIKRLGLTKEKQEEQQE